MPAVLNFKQLVTVLLLIFWAAAAYAAQVTFAHDVRDIPPAAVLISCLLAIIGGAAYTAQKIADPGITIKSVKLEIVKDVLTSIVVGLLAFFIGSYLQWDSMLQAGAITLGGYGGSRVLELVLGMAIRRLQRFGNGANQS
ncbi:phage holin family protein [Burkholderia gladioli]|uniref:phage holin family protein n=1 Tax=Burkholderia gladioli TaxID=28095 RepID=UPI00163F293B|nr:phage holin family protein [Burkholderia gladioli]